MGPQETADELRMKLTNYERTRRTSAPAMHRWLDGLIADTREQLRRLGERVHADADASRPSSARATAAPLASGDPRSTYPFDERAPWQRLGST